MITESDIRARFTAKRSEYAQRAAVTESKLRAAQAAGDNAEVERLMEKLTHLRINIRDCDAKVADAANVATKRNAGHDRASGQVIKPKGIDSAERMGRI
jgi:hypothetical protein